MAHTIQINPTPLSNTKVGLYKVGQSLLQLIETDLDHSASLSLLLVKERESLEQRALPKLQELLQVKNTLLLSIEENVTARKRLLLHIGITTEQGESQALDTFIDRTLTGTSNHNSKDLADDLKSQYLKLKDSLNACRNYNDLNGLIIAKSRQRNNVALRLLQGKFLQDNAAGPLYDAAGQTQATGSDSLSPSLQA